MANGTWLGRSFEDHGPIEFQRDQSGKVVEFSPQSRYSKAKMSALHKYGGGEFCKFRVRGLTNNSGVYVLCVDGKPIYAGRAENLKARFVAGYGNISPKNCFVGGQQTNCRLNQLILNAARQGRSLTLFSHECEDFAAFELALIGHLLPAWNLGLKTTGSLGGTSTFE